MILSRKKVGISKTLYINRVELSREKKTFLQLVFQT